MVGLCWGTLQHCCCYLFHRTNNVIRLLLMIVMLMTQRVPRCLIPVPGTKYLVLRTRYLYLIVDAELYVVSRCVEYAWRWVPAQSVRSSNCATSLYDTVILLYRQYIVGTPWDTRTAASVHVLVFRSDHPQPWMGAQAQTSAVDSGPVTRKKGLYEYVQIRTCRY